jgi:hypothetical protein
MTWNLLASVPTTCIAFASLIRTKREQAPRLQTRSFIASTATWTVVGLALAWTSNTMVGVQSVACGCRFL